MDQYLSHPLVDPFTLFKRVPPSTRFRFHDKSVPGSFRTATYSPRNNNPPRSSFFLYPLFEEKSARLKGTPEAARCLTRATAVAASLATVYFIETTGQSPWNAQRSANACTDGEWWGASPLPNEYPIAR